MCRRMRGGRGDDLVMYWDDLYLCAPVRLSGVDRARRKAGSGMAA